MTPGELTGRTVDVVAELVTWPIGLAWGLLNVRRYRRRYEQPDPAEQIPIWLKGTS